MGLTETMSRIVMFLCALAATAAISESLNSAELPFATESEFIEDEVVPEFLQTGAGCNNDCKNHFMKECNGALQNFPQFKKQILPHFNGKLKGICQCSPTCGKAKTETPVLAGKCDCDRYKQTLNMEEQQIMHELQSELNQAEYHMRTAEQSELAKSKAKHGSAKSKKEKDQIVAAYHKKKQERSEEYQKAVDKLKADAAEDKKKKRAFYVKNCPSCKFD